MTAMDSATLYVGINLLILMILAYLVVAKRQKHKIAFGDGGVEGLARAIRVHANAVEYAPAGLIGLVALAAAGAPALAVHVGGAALTIGRALHAQGFSSTSGRSFGRFAGTLLTWIALTWIAGAALWTALT